jgi:hypothetical protein
VEHAEIIKAAQSRAISLFIARKLFEERAFAQAGALRIRQRDQRRRWRLGAAPIATTIGQSPIRHRSGIIGRQ